MITIARCLSEDYIHSSKLKNFCYVPEEDDIQNVLQTVFENY